MTSPTATKSHKHEHQHGIGHIHHIPQGRPFAEDLARGMMDMITDPLDMADSIIMLPNRRLAKDLRNAFLKLAKGNAQLLPRIMPIGDVDEDASELVMAGWDADDLPPVIDGLERQLCLSRLISAFLARGKDPSSLGMSEILSLASALADFLDQMQTAGCAPSKLAELDNGEHADHWGKILKFLEIVTDHYPQVLAELNKSDPVIWQAAAIAARGRAWQQSPPKGMVVIAGSSGSVAATQTLMKAVLNLPRGHIVLSGLDVEMDEDDWQDFTRDTVGIDSGDIDDGIYNSAMLVSHPQFPLSQLFDALEINRCDVACWHGTTISPNPYDANKTGRLALLREAMRPAEQAGKWRQISERQEIKSKSLEGLTRVDCYDRRAEAEVIAIAMREVLATPEKTAVLITADQRLSRMVSAALKRWGVEVTSTAGRRLIDTPSAQFLRLIIDAWVADFAAVPLLAMARHRLAAGGVNKDEFRKQLRVLELNVLRGRRVQDGLLGVEKKARAYASDLGDFVRDRIIEPLKPLIDLNEKGATTLTDLVDAHGRAAESLSATPLDTLALWQGQDGARLGKFLHRLGLYGGDILLTPDAYPGVLNVLLSGEMIYPEERGHPRLAILGNVEARMQTADLTILGGMNEGITPPPPPPDPWMSNAMRRGFGLPHGHWRIGHTAHDAVGALARPEVLITRASRDDGSPTEPSRWLRRLDAVMEVAGLKWPDPTRLPYLAASLNRYDGKLSPSIRPDPKPPIAARPRQFSATQLDTLLRDPYAAYARRILKLKALPPLNEPLGAADKGTVIHMALMRFIQAYPSGVLPKDAYQRLIAIGKQDFAGYDDDPRVRTFWWPRFEDIAQWFIENEQKRRDDISHSHAEISGKIMINNNNNSGADAGFILTAKADRLDVMNDGTLHIIDYKTGGVPTKKNVADGRSLQLLVEAVIAADGGFPEINAAEVSEIAYWKLSGKRGDPADISNVTPDQGFTQHARQGFINLLTGFDNINAGYLSEPRASEVNEYSDYKHLARVREWSSIVGEDE